MEKLLPTIEELKPITDKNNTFYDCGFNIEFDKLNEKQKLQVICDIVRETIYPNPIPNPQNDIELLNGNCHTACLVAKKYLEELNLCKNVKYVMARKRCFDPEDIVSIHSMLLVTSNSDKVYQFDATPYVGYNFGKVEEIENKIYEEYISINDDMFYFLRTYQEIIYKDSIGKFNIENIDYYLKQCLDSLEYDILGAYCGNALKVLIKYVQDVDIKNRLEELIKKLRPYSKTNKSKKDYQRKLLDAQVLLWQEELNDLISSDKNIKRQKELCSNIIQELKMFDSSMECYRQIYDEKVRLSFMNPRFMYEKGLSDIMIKTSAYFLEKDKFIKSFFEDKYRITGEYITNLSLPTQDTGVKPMLFSHPLGETCIRSLMGQSQVFLVEKDPKTLNAEKKYLRELLCSEMWNQRILWIDGEEIVWDPFVTNLVHATDNACETSLHYSIAYPEHQSMTRFMYPNPKLYYRSEK